MKAINLLGDIPARPAAAVDPWLIFGICIGIAVAVGVALFFIIREIRKK